jgi:hypothetical protein
MRRGWFRGNRLALAAVLVLLPATLWVTFANSWFGYFEGWPSRPIDVAAGEPLDYGGAGWQIESTERYSADSETGRERNLPASTDLLVVTVRVDPVTPPAGEDGMLCTARLEEIDGAAADRSWSNGTRGAVQLDGDTPEFGSCNAEQRSPYSFGAEFVVPADAGDAARLAIGIAVVRELPDYARFALD